MENYFDEITGKNCPPDLVSLDKIQRMVGLSTYLEHDLEDLLKFEFMVRPIDYGQVNTNESGDVEEIDEIEIDIENKELQGQLDFWAYDEVSRKIQGCMDILDKINELSSSILNDEKIGNEAMDMDSEALIGMIIQMEALKDSISTRLASPIEGYFLLFDQLREYEPESSLIYNNLKLFFIKRFTENLDRLPVSESINILNKSLHFIQREKNINEIAGNKPKVWYERLEKYLSVELENKRQIMPHESVLDNRPNHSDLLKALSEYIAEIEPDEFANIIESHSLTHGTPRANWVGSKVSAWYFADYLKMTYANWNNCFCFNDSKPLHKKYQDKFRKGSPVLDVLTQYLAK